MQGAVQVRECRTASEVWEMARLTRLKMRKRDRLARRMKAPPVAPATERPALIYHCPIGPVTREQQGPQPVTMKQILAAVAAHYGVTVLDMISERRTKEVVIPRQVACYLGRHMTTRACPRLGKQWAGAITRPCFTRCERSLRFASKAVTSPPTCAR